MKLVNLTPHAVHLITETSRLTVPVHSDGPARVEALRTALGTLPVLDAHGLRVAVPLYSAVFGQVTNLPEPQAGVAYIVSRMVAEASPTRKDLLIPEDTVRDAQGIIVGCRGFAVFGAAAIVNWYAKAGPR